MSLLPLVGHHDLRARLRNAAFTGRLPQSLLFHGPPGAGKQRLALWLAALVLCDSTEDDERPCGRCRSCRMADGLQHPDIHWFFPLPSPKGASGPAKRRQKLEEARLEALAMLRQNPLEPAVMDPAASIFLPIVEEVRARAVRRPAMSRTAVFVIAGAERLVPQASSPEAANALLKLLEEPPPDTLLFLTSSRPGALLPTIRSRLLAVRVTPLDEATAVAFLEDHAGVGAEEARRLARRSQGSVGRALELAGRADGDPREKATGLLGCALIGSWSDRLRMAASYPSTGGRGTFSAVLGALDEVLRDALSRSAGAGEAAFDPELHSRLPAIRAVEPEALLRSLAHLDHALDAAAGNGNPQAIAAVLLAGMATELQGARGMAE